MKTTYITIENDGEIDVNGFTLIGASSKRDDGNKIGFFGSGNKYAIALLLRKKIPFKIFSGKKEIKFTTEKVPFRGDIYSQILIDGQKTSLTAEMGPDWETWFAIREFYSNALDEGGASLGVSQSPKGIDGKTCIYIKMVPEIEEFFTKRDRFFLIPTDARKNTVKTEYGRVALLSKKDDEFICYRKSIRIMPTNSTKSLFWYNFDSIQINESRTYKYEHEVQERIASYFAATENRDEIETYLSQWKGSYEENAKWEYVFDPLSVTWHTILFGHRVYPENLAMRSGDFEGKANSFIVPNTLAKRIAEQFKDIEVVGFKNDKHFVELEPTSDEKRKIETALSELRAIRYDIQLPVKIAETMTGDVVAWYDDETKTIYHTRKHLTTVRELKNTLLEEYFHHLGQVDGQRTFVTFLIDEIIDRS